eukprot:CAMPEP_0196575520 /NCGR_PEP_ID=MMETSP1081-20130531/4982_1 /TAXON_ID=36882 /ORGANISM="Pyramimonas amylifera, Strain CCMP720" /LENGTH=846 /DNA_ID=CAMNT_0041893849 /DNA_START=115 /DNA_END=2652 /DNA_ORIENTATION=+
MTAESEHTAGDIMDDLMPTEEDLLYEEELLRNPYTLKLWWRYLEARKDATTKRRHLLFERAVKALPGSYKLWFAYLSERRVVVKGLPVDHPAYSALCNCFERALVTMHKMPRVWEMFLGVLSEMRLITRARRTFDRALCSLPITQHDRVWTLYLDFVRKDFMPMETSLRVYRRYLQLEPGHAEEYVEFLKTKDQWNEVALKLADLVNDDSFQSLAGKTKHQLWLELCDIITKHPAEVKSLQVDAILRGGIRKFSDEVGRLWTSLADYYIRRALFERARDVYEEGMTTVTTVRDFSTVFDAYMQFEESMLSAKMEQLAGEGEDAGEDEEDEGVDFLLKDDGNDVDLRLARLEYHMHRRPALVNSVILRQNPHNVHEWHKRVKLFEGNPTKQILTFTEAVKTVLIQQAVGKPHTLWVSFAKFYEKHGDVPNARVIFEKAVQVPYKGVDDLAAVWCEWAELELRHNNFDDALALLHRATQAPPKYRGTQDDNPPVQKRLFKCLKVWTFLCDLEESLGTLESARAVYDRILDLKIATPQIILNYAHMLWEHKFFEDAFQIYEKGVAVFKYPHVKDIWQAYLTQFTSRYGGKKLERARDLYEQALEKAPAGECKTLYLQYAKLEEEYGLGRHAMSVYERACKAVPDSEKLEVYELYLNRAMDFFGVGKVREIFEMAIESSLSEASVKAMCLKFAELERRLGEIDRARSLYVHASQFADPLQDSSFWSSWNEFEVGHGNEDTFREMLRVKRSVSASYSQTHFTTALAGAGLVAPQPDQDGGIMGGPSSDGMAALEQQAEAARGVGAPLSGFVSGGVEGEQVKAGGAKRNQEEIDLGEDEDEDEDIAGGPERE